MNKIFGVIIISALLFGLFFVLGDFCVYNYPGTDLDAGIIIANDNLSKIALSSAKRKFYNGEYSAAEDIYIDLITKKPYEVKYRRDLSAVYADLGEVKKENMSLLKTAILSGESRDFLDLAVNYYQIGKLDTAIFLLENKVADKKLGLEEFLFKKYFLLTALNIEKENIDKAENYLIKAEEYSFSDSRVFILKSALDELKNNYYAAYQNLYQAYENDKSKTFLFKDMALLLEKADEEIKAYNHWQKAFAYGWFKGLALEKINYYKDKYPSLRIEGEKETPEKINPFNLKADWTELSKISFEEKSKKIKVGLQENNKNLVFQSKSDFKIIKNSTVLFNGEKMENYILNIDTGNLYIEYKTGRTKLGEVEGNYEISNEEYSSFYIFNLNYGEGYFWQGRESRQYRGDLLIKGDGSQFTIINNIDLTSYLISVVPSEIYASWPDEALKAQAIAARSYTLSNLGRHKDDGYDLCSTVHCATYNGVKSEHPNTTEAVLFTQGETAYYKDNIIEAVFSSNSGGFTERSDEIWQSDLPYLRGANQMIDESYSFPLSPYELKKWIVTEPESYSKKYGGNRYRWQLNISKEVLEYSSKLQNINKISITDRASGGTVTKLKIIGDSEEKIYSGYQIRRVFAGIRNSRIILEPIYSNSGEFLSVNIYGAGWGHNLGFDQSAAAGMAAEGWSYREIINHFYPETEIRKFSKSD
ncbi:SpoIID/LytB domain protein [Halanaerobium sp. DL-01]|uniref:SpoIID/LytB domain-containing protein n=1 Tax=Halanaerobium sp. DL-01 TaxID=1653064 RepID=UPI000DF44BD9|nr:SpoIID/LytB domain-containing protein [Halanaerobium sp. DL-01]RCW89264.1 SpoIID/LytB domain protein [Halanaerobium sp. DL-01]